MPLRPPAASAFAAPYDALFLALTLLTALFSGAVIGMTVFFCVRYRQGSPVRRKRPEHENLKLEVAILGIPLVLGLVMFTLGAKLYLVERHPPKDATEVFVVGKQWMWHIEHPDGVREMNTLTVPLGKPVRVTMISEDVVHALYIPAFRIQYQAIPGRYTSLWFTPTRAGRYLMLCNMYCGTDHSRMVGHVDVLEPDDFAKWLARNAYGRRTPVPSLLESGRALFQKNACFSCHGAADSARGPSLVGLFGRTRLLADGSSASADEDYLRISIARPEYQIAAGYTNAMPNYPSLKEDDIRALVTYIESLSGGKP